MQRERGREDRGAASPLHSCPEERRMERELDLQIKGKRALF